MILLLCSASSFCACCTCVLLSPTDQRECRCVKLSSPGCSDTFIMPCQWLSCCTCVLLSPTDQRGAESGAAGKPRGSPQRFSKTSLQCLCLSCEFLPHPSLPSSLPEPLEGPHIFLIMPTIAVLWLSEIHTL